MLINKNIILLAFLPLFCIIAAEQRKNLFMNGTPQKPPEQHVPKKVKQKAPQKKLPQQAPPQKKQSHPVTVPIPKSRLTKTLISTGCEGLFYFNTAEILKEPFATKENLLTAASLFLAVDDAYCYFIKAQKTSRIDYALGNGAATLGISGSLLHATRLIDNNPLSQKCCSLVTGAVAAIHLREMYNHLKKENYKAASWYGAKALSLTTIALLTFLAHEE